MLPSDEAESYCRSLFTLKNAATQPLASKIEVPPTWKMLHSQDDNITNLTPDAFLIMQEILRNLAELKTIK